MRSEDPLERELKIVLIWVLGTNSGSSTRTASVLDHLSHVFSPQIMILEQCLPLENTMKEDRLGTVFAGLSNTAGVEVNNILKLISNTFHAL